MILDVPTREEVDEVRMWRNDELQFLRTPYRLTAEMQYDFYTKVIDNRDSPHKYFSVHKKYLVPVDDTIQNVFIGFGGLTNIDYINGHTEISLIMDPDMRGSGFGREAVSLLLKEAFANMRLNMVYGEVYHCGHHEFWEKLTYSYGGYYTTLQARKFWDGVYWDSTYFSITEEQWRNI